MVQQIKRIIKFRHLIFLIPFIIFAVLIYYHTDNAITQDLGRHLILGKIIWTTRSIPQTNLFSYTYPGFPFQNHHWGSEVIFFLIDKISGINGLIFLKTCIAVGAFVLIFIKTIIKKGTLPIIAGSLLSLEILRERTEIRPEIFGYLLFSLILVILFEEKIKEGRRIWILPLINIIWVNLHISFIFGPVLYFLFTLDRLLSGKMKIKYLVLGILVILSILVNPYGINGAISPFRIFDNYGYPIVENQSPFFIERLTDNPTILYFKIALFLILILSPVLISNKSFFEAGIVLATGIISISAIRHFPFFALSLIYPFALGFEIIFRKIEYIARKNIQRIYLLWISFSVLLLLFILNESFSLWSNSYYKDRYMPIRTGNGQVEGMEKTADYFIKNDIKEPLFNNFDIGSYLVYRLYPGESVFVDGRPEAYPAGFFQHIYIPMQENENIWQEVSERYNIRSIIISHTDQTPWAQIFIRNILNSVKWKVVYLDDFGLIILRNDIRPDLPDIRRKILEYGYSVIQKYTSRDENLRLAHFFNLAGWKELENTAFMKAENNN